MYQNWIKYNTETPPKYPQTFTGKERDSETGFSYFGARYYDSDILTAWLSVDPMADKYPGVSPYAYCAWNPIRLVDPDGEEIDISALEKKNKDGSYKYNGVREAIKFFASTEYGKKELAKYAKAGQTIFDHTYTEDGIYHKEGIDLNIGAQVSQRHYSGDTKPNIDGKRLKLSINISNSIAGKDQLIDSKIETFCHELFIHAYLFSQDYIDDKTFNFSNINKNLIKWKNDYNVSVNNLHQQQDKLYNNRMSNEAIPILESYYKSVGKNVSSSTISNMINDGLQIR